MNNILAKSKNFSRIVTMIRGTEDVNLDKSRKANKSGLAICKFTYMGGITYGRFRTDRIRNVVLLGHSGSGKTSLTEAMVSFRYDKPSRKSDRRKYRQRF